MEFTMHVILLLITNIIIIGFMHRLAPDEYETIIDLITFLVWSIIYSVMLYNYNEQRR